MHFEDIYNEYFDRVWRTVRRLGVAEKDTLDVTQEVFVVAYRRRNEFEGRSAMSTWLYGIAFRVAAMRRRRASHRYEQLDNEAIPATVGPDPVTTLEHRDLLRLLEAVLDTLPFEQRAVFTMFEMEGLTGEEIAVALGTTEGTVRSRLRLARQAFRQAVGSWSEGSGAPLVLERRT